MHVLRLDVGPSVDEYVNRVRPIVVRCKQKGVANRNSETGSGFVLYACNTLRGTFNALQTVSFVRVACINIPPLYSR